MTSVNAKRLSSNGIKCVRTALSVSVLLMLSPYASAQEGDSLNLVFNHANNQPNNAWGDKPVIQDFRSQKNNLESAQMIADVSLYTPAQIEARLQGVSQQNSLMMHPLSNKLPISKIDAEGVPAGLDVNAIIKIVAPNTLQTLGITEEGQRIEGVDKKAAIVTHEDGSIDGITKQEEIKRPNVVKRLYNRLFNDGVETVVRLEVDFYKSGTKMNAAEPNPKVTKMNKTTLKKEPFANIKAALEDIAATSITDFNSALPRLKQTAESAARAVGYYDVNMQIVKVDVGKIRVVISDIGEPVRIATKVLEVRGEGANNPSYQKVMHDTKLSQGEVFHHGHYESTKNSIIDVSAEDGYFDGKWLDNSVDVILPDNIADVSLVYDSGRQYEFGEVVFFTIDEETGQFTTDPKKLPVKSELLKKLVTFEMGDAYNRSAARNLSNNLLATGYFNVVNTEMILPSLESTENQIDFEDSSEGRSQERVSDVVDLGDGISMEVEPIEFTASEAIQAKLARVTQKAQRLYNMPDDRLLVTDTRKKSRSILGRISDAVSSVAKMILPDESGDEIKISEGAEVPVLMGRKSPQDVYMNKKVPLYVFVMSDKPRDAQIGLGWGSDSGARMITKFEHNLINKNGYQAGADIRFSENKKGLNLYATKPLSHPLNDKLRAFLSYGEEKIGGALGTFALSTRTLQHGISRNIVKESGWNRSYTLRYRLDELKTGAPMESWGDLPVRFINGKPTQEALLAGITINKTVADNLVNPMRGYRQNYSLEVGAKNVISDTNMAILRAGVSGIYSFGNNTHGKDRAHQIIGSLNIGYLWADSFEDVPYKLRFFAGGDQSIRGYNYDSLSPISKKGYLTGGQALAVASGEYNYEVLEGLRVAAFVDAGNAYDKNFKNETKIGTGLGIRWASPVGQVRVDVATGVKEEGHPIKLHFFIGTPF